jgi:hypothetical protein
MVTGAVNPLIFFSLWVEEVYRSGDPIRRHAQFLDVEVQLQGRAGSQNSEQPMLQLLLIQVAFLKPGTHDSRNRVAGTLRPDFEQFLIAQASTSERHAKRCVLLAGCHRELAAQGGDERQSDTLHLYRRATRRGEWIVEMGVDVLQAWNPAMVRSIACPRPSSSMLNDPASASTRMVGPQIRFHGIDQRCATARGYR